MSRTYLVHLPSAEARHLAGTGRPWPPGRSAARERPRATPPGGPGGSRMCQATLDPPAVAQRPVRGPFAPGRGGQALPGRVEYLGGGTVRLDETAISSLAGLDPDDDFRVIFLGGMPVLTVGGDRYLAREEEPGRGP